KQWVGGSSPSAGTNKILPGPDTQVTVCTQDMGDRLVPKGESRGRGVATEYRAASAPALKEFLRQGGCASFGGHGRSRDLAKTDQGARSTADGQIISRISPTRPLIWAGLDKAFAN